MAVPFLSLTTMKTIFITHVTDGAHFRADNCSVWSFQTLIEFLSRRRSTPKTRSWTRPSPSGLATRTTFLKRSTASFTSPWQTTGKNTSRSSISRLKVNSSSEPCSSSPSAPPSICSRTRSRRTTSSSTSDEVNYLKKLIILFNSLMAHIH